jgi:PAS domain S-box-containing protein
MARLPLPARLVAGLATAAAYAVVGLLALKLAIPPGFASPLFPSAGIALAAVLVFGPSMLPGVVAGSLVVNIGSAAFDGRLGTVAVATAVCIAVAAALQALVASLLVRRFVRRPLVLDEAREVLLFFALAAPLACTVGASLSSRALGAAGVVPWSQVQINWITWWSGDVLGTLIGAPVAFTLIGRPRSEWAPRRLTVGLTLTLLTLLLAVGITQVARYDRERVRDAFERDASVVSASLSNQVLEPLHAAEALRGVVLASPVLTREGIRRATAPWLKTGHLQAMGWSPRVAADQLPSFEAAARAEGFDGYRVFDRTAGARVTVAGHDPVVPIRYIEPLQGNTGALGVNSLSIPVARAAIEAATRSGQAVASAGFQLTQRNGQGLETGVVVYQPVAAASEGDAAGPAAGLRGVVFVTLAVDTMLRDALQQLPAYLKVCVVDVTKPAAPHRLGGEDGCEAATPALRHERRLAFAGREWTLRVSADSAELPYGHNPDTWLFSGIGLMAASLLGALLLIVTGRTQRIEAAVDERTAALQAEVAERELAQSAMRESEQRFRNIFNNVPIGVVYTDLEGNVKQANPSFAEFLNYRPQQLLSMHTSDYTHQEDLAEAADFTRRLIAGQIPMYRQRCRYITQDGRVVWVRATVSVLRDGEGRPQRIVGVMEDVTEHLRLEEAEKARDLAQAANQAKSEFLSRMSHELRTPLNAMLGFAQLLELDRRNPLAPHQLPWVEQVQRAGWHLLDMINDVLDLSRIESDNLRLQSEPLNLAELVSAAVAMTAAGAAQRAVTVSVELGEGTSTVLGDATRIKQILTNLLSNAVKYNHHGGHIQVTSRVRGTESVEIVVADDGLGMTEEQLGGLFQPFNRLGRERSAHDGTGIGLVVSLRLAELMGGSLEAESRAGEGSSFTLTLPSVLDPDTVRSEHDRLSPDAPGYHGRVVLYVEDNETNVEVMRGILAQRPQVTMRVALNGLDALATVRQRVPDLILLDMHLPDISGLELLRHLKADPGTAGVPIVIVSADALADQIDEALEAGATGYVTKPVNIGELLGVLDDLLGAIASRFG